MKLRLLLTEKCNRRCRGCCNKDYDLAALPVCEDFAVYEEIMLTGGEPMLFPADLSWMISKIQNQTKAPIFLYTANCTSPNALMTILDRIDGITLTLHRPHDVEPFRRFNDLLQALKAPKSLRLNVFKGVSLKGLDTSKWTVRKNITWRINCPIPQDEVFMRAI
jgi:hypothetical protein